MAEKEFIDRGVLISELKKSSKECELYGEWEDCRWSYESDIFEIVESAPKAEVQEVNHGRWIPKHYEDGLLGGSNVDECSECGYERLIRDMKYRTIYSFCPRCGAKMDGEQK